MRPQRLDDTLHLPSFRSKWASLPPEDRAVIRGAFVDLQRNPSIAEHTSWLVRLRTWLLEIHVVLCGYVLFTFCEVLRTGAMIVIDALVLPTIDAPA
jgi:hypothetical protein